MPKLSTCANYVSRARGIAINSSVQSLWLAKLYRCGGRLKCPEASDTRNYPRMKMQRPNNGWYPSHLPWLTLKTSRRSTFNSRNETQKETKENEECAFLLMQFVHSFMRKKGLMLRCARASRGAIRVFTRFRTSTKASVHSGVPYNNVA